MSSDRRKEVKEWSTVTFQCLRAKEIKRIQQTIMGRKANETGVKLDHSVSYMERKDFREE